MEGDILFSIIAFLSIIIPSLSYALYILIKLKITNWKNEKSSPNEPFLIEPFKDIPRPENLHDWENEKIKSDSNGKKNLWRVKKKKKNLFYFILP